MFLRKSSIVTLGSSPGLNYIHLLLYLSPSHGKEVFCRFQKTDEADYSEISVNYTECYKDTEFLT